MKSKCQKCAVIFEGDARFCPACAPLVAAEEPPAAVGFVATPFELLEESFALLVRRFDLTRQQLEDMGRRIEQLRKAASA